ncbi:hypothetical protein AMAG_04905 [Allomyces macrogynus ATCC 38327]|uniref:Diphthine--ammonia ligase n=1 Tax=Allomyces macrogynus (strain ATCC 38327) TaxID=578462 RepID=A0A0L0S6M0_ALLM3|nr:hypothetical protein AMAG_04905 [Allomyces macrogynus ATCC 38327]|eukprot:KNE58085.1 hypothetical protein AMAG_04905 [Allomyces macrogynus ATCC 38327]
MATSAPSSPPRKRARSTAPRPRSTVPSSPWASAAPAPAPAAWQPRKPRVAVCFTGGKDSMLALHLLLHRPDLLVSDLGLGPNAPGSAAPPPSIHLGPLANPIDPPPAPAHLHADDFAASPRPSGRWPAAQLPYEVAALVVFHPARPQFLSHPLPVMHMQARAMGLPLVPCRVDGPDFRASYVRAVAALNVDVLVSGDMTESCSGFMRSVCVAAGVHFWCPLWHMDRAKAWDMILDRFAFHAVLTCVHVRRFLRTWGSSSENATVRARPARAVAAAKRRGEPERDDGGDTDPIDPVLATDATDADADGAMSPLLIRSPSPTALAGPASRGGGGRRARTATPILTPAPTDDDDSNCGPPLPSTTTPSATRLFDTAMRRAHTVVGTPLNRTALRSWLEPAALRDAIDLCGEMGEYHTMVLDGPLFAHGPVNLHGQSAVDPSGEYVYLKLDSPPAPPVVPVVVGPRVVSDAQGAVTFELTPNAAGGGPVGAVAGPAAGRTKQVTAGESRGA